MLRVSVVAPAAILTSPDWHEVVSYSVESGAASCMGMLYDYDVPADDVVVSFAPRFTSAGSTSLPDTLIYIEVAAPLTASRQLPGILESYLRAYKARIERVLPASWDGLAKNLVRIGFVPMTACV
jgi:hypothetical protein